MRILVLHESDWVERNPIMHHRMLESLSRSGDEVLVIDFEIHWHSKGWRPLRKRRSVIRGYHKVYDDSNVTLIRPAMLRVPGLGRITWLMSNWWEIRAAIKRSRPDVMVAYGISSALLGYYLARRASIPFVYHVLDAYHALAEPPRLRPVARLVEGMVMRRADRVVVINDHLKAYAVSMGAREASIEIVPVGWTRTTTPISAGEQVRTELLVQTDEFLLLYIGWLYDFSGLREVALELARRTSEMPKVKVLIVGDGDLLNELEQIRSEHGLGDRLMILGRRPLADIPKYISAADACLLPALRVPAMEHIVPAKVGEYMEGGKPVIATRLPGLETEFGRLPGILYIDRPEEVLDRVEELLRDSRGGRETARQLGASCLEFASSRDDWDDVTDRFRAILQGPFESAALTRSSSRH
jgi:glycosyltransferase involved in cell wall biosynthesis